MLLVPTVSVVAHETSTRASLGHGGDFTLQSFDGPVSLEQMRGKVVLLFFGFTSCVDICPTTLAVLSKVFARLTEDELEKVIALFISLDPERDTPEVLKKYTGYFHSNIIGVTAREEVLSKVVADYGVAYERKEVPGSALGYVIYHTPDVLVVDEQGQLLDMRIQFTTTTEEIALGIKGLLGNNQ
jgi:protein SCO1/2